MLHKHYVPPVLRVASRTKCAPGRSGRTLRIRPHSAAPGPPHLAATRRTWAAHPDRFGDNGFTRRRIPCARFGTSDPANTADSRLALPLNLPGLGEPMRQRLISAIAILFVMLSPLAALA